MKSKVIRALLSLLIAFALWMYVVTVVSPGSEASFRGVQVTLLNENVLTERGLMVTSYTPSVNLALSGNRSDLNKLTSASMTAMANLSGITSEGTYQISYTPSYPSDVSGSAIAVQTRDPDYVTVTVETRRTKAVDVAIEFTGSVPEGFLADKENAELDYTQIELTGPASAVDQVEKAVIRVELEGQSETVSGTYRYTLCNGKNEPVDAQMIVTNVGEINCSVRIQRVKRIDLAVKVIPGGGATAKNCTVTVVPESIQIAGSDALLEGLNILEIGTVDLGVLSEDVELDFEILLPEGVRNETGVNEAHVSVQFKDLKTKTLNITEIKAVNVPTGMTLEMITKVLEITVRGPESLMDALTAENLTVTVDFSGAQAGTATAKAVITGMGDFAEVGALGAYSVSYTLK